MRIAITILTLVLGSALAAFAADRAAAHEPHPGLNFSISVDGVRDCNTRLGDATCVVRSGSNFHVTVYLDSLPDDIPGYGGFDIQLDYSGLTHLWESTSPWPDCFFPATYAPEGHVFIGCAIGLPPAGPSTYTGAIAFGGFACNQSGEVSLTHGNGDHTDLVEPPVAGLIKHSEGADARETLNITCGDPEPTPTPTGEAPGLPPTGQHASGTRVPAWLAVVFSIGGVLFAAAALALTGATTTHRR